MRWDGLFGDLDAQWHAASQEDLEREINERARVEAALVSMADALRGALGGEIAALMRNGVVHHGVVARVEDQWILLRESRRSLILPLAKIVKVQGLGPARAQQQGRIRYTLSSALRILARNRAEVVVELDSPQTAVVRGVVDQVGADFVMLTQLADGVGRGRANQQGGIIVPFTAVIAVMSSGENEF